jgi:hypothetical protein
MEVSMEWSRFVVVLAASALLTEAAVAQAERPWRGNPNELGQLPESGPPIVGGSGATAGPNSKNQATSPMPGRTDEEAWRRNPLMKLDPPEVRPVPGTPGDMPKDRR